MKTKINELTLACLDKDFESIRYEDAMKLDVDLYLKYLTAKKGIKKFPTLSKLDAKVGDYVYILQANLGFGMKGFGYIKQSEKGELYVDVSYLLGNKKTFHFLRKRIYLKFASQLALIFRK